MDTVTDIGALLTHQAERLCDLDVVSYLRAEASTRPDDDALVILAREAANRLDAHIVIRARRPLTEAELIDRWR